MGTDTLNFFEIRGFNAMLDYWELASWWKTAGITPPAMKKMPKNTFIVEVDGVAVVSVGLIATDLDIVWLDNLVGNPRLKGEVRREATKFLLEWIEADCRRVGFTSLFCMATHEKLKYYYEQLGFQLTAQQVYTFTKEL